MQTDLTKSQPLQVVRVPEEISRQVARTERDSRRRNRVPRFARRQSIQSTVLSQGESRFYAFDLLWLDGEDLRGLPLIERKQRLRELVKRSGCERLVYAQHIETQGIAFFEEICARDLEGIVCKRKRSIYKSNGTGWLKVKNPKYSQAEGRHDLFQARERKK